MNPSLVPGINKLKYLSFLLCLVSLLFVLECLAAETMIDIPPLTARVNDYAHMIPPGTAARIESMLEDLERTDSTQIVVVTIDSLEGVPLETYSIRLAEKWKIGQKGKDNGAILLVVKKERKIRIEVGYGLEGRLTDLVCGQIIRNIIVPRFRKGDFGGGIEAGIKAMIRVVRGEFKPGPAAGRHGDFIYGALMSALFLCAFLIQLGMIRKWLSAGFSAVLLPVWANMFFSVSGWILLLLFPAGFFLGLLLAMFAKANVKRAGHGRRYASTGFWYGGGFSGGGFGGGFSGGGGGFGGGGASGSW